MRCRRRTNASTRTYVKVEHFGPDRLELHIGRELKSPNEWLGGRKEYYESQAWERVLLGGMRSMPPEVIFRGWPPGRRRVSWTRLVPSKRNLLKDRDNRMYLCKPGNDALVRLGWIKDDREKHMEFVPPIEEVSEDKRYLTVLVIEPILGESSAHSSGSPGTGAEHRRRQRSVPDLTRERRAGRDSHGDGRALVDSDEGRRR